MKRVIISSWTQCKPNIRHRLSDRSVFSPRVWLMSAPQLVYQSHPLTLLSNWKWLERFPLAGGVFQTVFLSSLLNSVTAVILGCRTPKSTSCGRQTLTDFGSFFIVKDLFPSWRQNPWTSRQKSRLCKHFWDDLLQRTHREGAWRNLQDYSNQKLFAVCRPISSEERPNRTTVKAALWLILTFVVRWHL